MIACKQVSQTARALHPGFLNSLIGEIG